MAELPKFPDGRPVLWLGSTWNKCRAILKSWMPISGEGVDVRPTATGSIVAISDDLLQRLEYIERHPWKVYPAGNLEIYVARGDVNEWRASFDSETLQVGELAPCSFPDVPFNGRNFDDATKYTLEKNTINYLLLRGGVFVERPFVHPDVYTPNIMAPAGINILSGPEGAFAESVDMKLEIDTETSAGTYDWYVRIAQITTAEDPVTGEDRITEILQQRFSDIDLPVFMWSYGFPETVVTAGSGISVDNTVPRVYEVSTT